MANCNYDVNRFTITKNQDNTFLFTIKQNDSTLPIVIDVTDTFTASLVLLSDGSEALSKALTVVDALSGKVSLTITQLEADALFSEKGTKADRYYAKPTYKLIIACSTVSNGDFLAKVPEVYVD